MKAVVYEDVEKLSYKEVEILPVKSHEVRIRVKACGICGSDVHGYLGVTGRRIAPMIMGHEFCGEVVEKGADVENLSPGARVAVYPVDFCGECEMCRRGDVHLCLNKRAFGVLDVDGALAEYINVPAKCCFPIADEVSFATASLVEPLAVAFRGVGRAGSLEGKTVLIVGAGTIGLLALACIRMQKPSKILISDLSGHRLEVAGRMGADVLLNPAQEAFSECIMQETAGKGVDAAVEAVGAGGAVRQVMSSLKIGGSAVWIGNNSRMIEMDMQETVTRELRIQGSFLYGYQEFETVVNMLNEGKIFVEPLISKKISLSQTPEYFKLLAHTPGDLLKVVVVDE